MSFFSIEHFLAWPSFYNICSVISRFAMEQMAEELNMPNLDISKKLLTDEDRIIWENMGLTSDIQSMENAAILTKVQPMNTP